MGGLWAIKAHKSREREAQVEHRAVKYAGKKESRFVFVIPSFNNEKWAERNLASCLTQEYPDFRIIYINDASDDDTLDKVRTFLKQNDPEKRTTIVNNEERKGALSNIYRAIHSCDDDEVVVLLDGDDHLAHEKVLDRLDRIYSHDDAWVTYGSYVNNHSYKRGPHSKLLSKNVIKSGKVRNQIIKDNYRTSHLRSFYAGVFKQIPLKELIYEGDFFQVAGDVAVMSSLIELARDHTIYVNDVLCVYNTFNTLADTKLRREKQDEAVRHIVGRKPLAKTTSYIRENIGGKKADLLAFSYDRPLQLFAFLESVEKHITGLNQISVIYRSSGSKYDAGYAEVGNRFPHVKMIKQSNKPHEDFKLLVMESAFNGGSDYLLFAVDDIIVKDRVDLHECIEAMDQTLAYGFYLRLGSHVDYCYMQDRHQGIPELTRLDGSVRAWRFNTGADDWKYPNSVDMSLFKKSRIKGDFEKIHFIHPNAIEDKWWNMADFDEVGLCFEQSKILNIPLNLIHQSQNRNMEYYPVEELQNRFDKGWKMDITPFEKMENRSAHIDYEPTFVPRERNVEN